MQPKTLIALSLALAIPALPTGCAAQKAVEQEENAVQTLEEILQRASTEKKPVVLKSTGLDWCKACMILEKELEQPDFKKLEKEEIILHTVDFPAKEKQDGVLKALNRELAEKFNIKGFPTFVALDPPGGELGRLTGIVGETGALIRWIKKKRGNLDS